MNTISEEFKRLRNNARTDLCNKLRKELLEGFYKGLKSVDPEELINGCFKIQKSTSNLKELFSIMISGLNLADRGKIIINLSRFTKILIIGGGKATAPMTNALVKILGKYVECSGIINVPYGQDWGNSINYQFKNLNSSVQINYASHPIPDNNGMNGTKKMIEYVKNSDKYTLICILISGGGSALMPLPGNGLQLEDLQKTNDLLLKSGADINEINTVRKHLSSFKGGNLARHFYSQKAISLIISDVIGDSLDIISSGPTVPDKSTYQEAEYVLKKYKLLERTPENIRLYIKKGLMGQIPENPKSNDPIFENIDNIIIGSAENARKEIEKSLQDNDIKSLLDYSDRGLLNIVEFPGIMKGEAKDFGVKVAQFLINLDNMQDKYNRIKKENSLYYLINSGELTVTIKGDGKGGRNQEMLLSVLCNLQNYSFKNIDFAIISMAFDGIEGNSSAAGAIIDSNSIQKIKSLDIDPETYLKDNNSFAFFENLGDAIKIGQTKTNINDIFSILINFQ